MERRGQRNGPPSSTRARRSPRVRSLRAAQRAFYFPDQQDRVPRNIKLYYGQTAFGGIQMPGTLSASSERLNEGLDDRSAVTYAAIYFA